jgi:Fic family protein
MDSNLKPSKVPVPPALSEPTEWNEAGSGSRRVQLASRGKFQSTVPARISQIKLVLSDELAAEVEDATAALIRFDQEGVLTNASLGAVLLRSESASSSQVELLHASPRQVGLAQLGISGSTSANLVVDNVQAMLDATSAASNPTREQIIQMHRVLLERSNPSIVGAFRSRPVWIGGPTPHLAKFVGPQPGRIESAIEDLVVFMSRTDLPRLVQVAVAHAQFETIHPFEDGNGRTGRALMHSMLKANGISTRSVAPISAGLLKDTRSYFAGLDAYRAGDASPIIRSVTAACFHAVDSGRALLKGLRSVQERMSLKLEARAGSVADRLIEHLPEYPALNSRKVQELLSVSEPAALAGLRTLESAGILVPNSGAKRSMVWLAPEVLEVWSSFAQERDKP